MIRFDRTLAKERYEAQAALCGKSYIADAKNAVNDVRVNGTHADVKLIGAIDDWFGINVEETIAKLDNQKLDSINLVINSPGGLFWQGNALYHDLMARQNDGVTITTEGRGMVASAAVLPFLASNTIRKLTENTVALIHRPFLAAVIDGDYEEIMATASRIANYAKVTNDVLTNIINKYVNPSNRKNLDGWLKNEKLFHADEAVEVGMATSVISDDGEGSNNNDVDGIKDNVIELCNNQYADVALNFDKRDIYTRENDLWKQMEQKV